MKLLLSSIFYFDSDNKSMKYGSILVEDDKIISVGQNDTTADVVIDGTGKYLIPGLIDTHIHFFQSAGLFTRPDGLDLRHVKSYEQEFEDIKHSLPELFKRYIATGVTSVVDCGGPFWNFQVKEQAEAAKIAPHVAVAGPLVSTVSREKLDLGDPPIIKAENPDHARELVRKCAEQEPAFIKFWYIYLEDSFEIDSTIMAAGMDECKKLGQRIAVHATELETAKRAVKYGANILVHSVFTEKIDQEFVDLLKENEVIYIPTLMVRNGYRDVFHTRLFLTDYEQRWGDPDVINTFEQLILLDTDTIPESHRSLRDDWSEPPIINTEDAYYNLKTLHEAGVRIATGTDAGNVGTLHGPSLHTEMEHMIQAQMETADVLLATTKYAAQVLGMDKVGEIKAGYQADLVVLNADPLMDITNANNINTVILNGKPLKPEELIPAFDPISVVQGQFNAYNTRNVDKFLSYYHPRVQIMDKQSGEILMEGIEVMRKRYTALFENSPELHVELINRIALGPMVIDHEKVFGHLGRKFPIQALAYYEIKHQKIARVWFSR